MMRYLLLYSLLFASCKIQSQDLTGTWEGHSSNMASYVKMVIVRQGNTYIGYTYDDGMGFCQANFLGNFNEAKQLLTGKGMGFIRRSLTHSQARFRLTYSQKGDVDYLEGVALPKTAVTTILSFGMTERVSLQRTTWNVDTTSFMRERLDKHEMAADDRDADTIFTEQTVADSSPDTIIKDNLILVKRQRIADTISRIVTAEKTITITLFDNGQVDGDTITVFHNNELLLSRHYVSAIPYKITLTLSKEQPFHELVLVANNLGSIPPNTAVLLVDAGDKRYRLTASSDMRKNAVLIFEFKE